MSTHQDAPRITSFVVFVITVVLGIATVACGRSRADYTPDFDPRDFPVLVETLALDAERAAAARIILERHDATFREAASRIRRRVAAEVVRLDGPDDDIEAAFARTKEARAAIIAGWNVERERLRAAFVAELQSLLTDDQLGRWPDLERRMRRERLLPRGLLSGESVDLVRVVDALRLDPVPAPVTGLLEAYAIELDHALRVRAALPEATDATGRTDPDHAPDHAPEYDPHDDPAREVRARTKVRDINLSYADRVAGALPGDDSAAFRVLFDRKAFPRVYRDTVAQRRLRAAASGSPRAESDPRIAAIEAVYLARMTDLQDRLRETVRRHEPALLLRRLEHSASAQEDPDRDAGEDPIRDGLANLRALEEEMLSRLREAATPDGE